MKMTMSNPEAYENSVWKIDTLNVGQADAHTLRTPTGTRVIIDADEEQIADALDDTTANHLLITHIHTDHVFGIQHLDSVENAHWPNTSRYTVSSDDGCVEPAVLEECVEGLSEVGISLSDIETHTSGDKILDEEDATLTALSPPATAETVEITSQSTGYPCTFKPEEANANGAVCAFEGPSGVSGLFMGDVGDESAHNAESWLLEQHNDSENDVVLDAEILYLGHHGSNNSSGESFLDAVGPEHVVISSGLDNNYTSENQYDGHPHDETLERLHERDVQVHWTAVHGRTSTTVEDGTIRHDHDTGLETTAAADIAALKYYARANDLDQEALADSEEITLADLPEETPEWAEEASIVTEPSTIDRDRIDELHALEVEQGNLKQEQRRLEGTRNQRLEQKTTLEQENDKGLTGRLTTAVSSFWETEVDEDENTQQAHATDQNDKHTDPDQQAETDTDEQEYEDIEAAIDAYEQQNESLRAAVETLSEQVDELDQQIETLDTDRTEREGLFERLRNAVGTRQAARPTDETTPHQPETGFSANDSESSTDRNRSSTPESTQFDPNNSLSAEEKRGLERTSDWSQYNPPKHGPDFTSEPDHTDEVDSPTREKPRREQDKKRDDGGFSL